MLRLLVAFTLTLFSLIAISAAAMRWIGQQQYESHFPLPDANGCWQNICLSEPSTKEGVIAVLDENPRIRGITAPVMTVLGYYQINFIYTGTSPQSVRLHWLPSSYELMRDSTEASNPPLMTIGDVLSELGTPDRVDSYGISQTRLEYFEQGLIVSVLHRDFGPYGMRIRPNDPVISLWQFPPDTEFVLYPIAWEWHGFGLYLR